MHHSHATRSLNSNKTRKTRTNKSNNKANIKLTRKHQFSNTLARIYDNAEIKIEKGEIAYITGESGSGKSTLLKALEKDIHQHTRQKCININTIKPPPPNKPIIETVGKNLEEALNLLSHVGLNDAFLFLRPYNQLSDGQKYRYKIAKLIESQAQV
jgi:ABC-type ATPase with predicted acetyltransferase domain